MKIKNPRNMLKYQEKGLWAMSLRQIIYLIIGVGIYFLVGIISFKLGLPIQAAFLVALLPAAPFIMAAFLKVSGLPFDVIIKRLLGAIIFNRDYRPYKTKGFK